MGPTVEDGWLVTPRYQKLTPNRYHAKYKAGRIKPVEAIVYHYTVSSSGTGTVRWLQNPRAGASADFVVSRKGTIFQLAPLGDRTWHAGGATSELLGAKNVNGRTKGIEIVNWGPLFKDGQSFWTQGRNPKRVDSIQAVRVDKPSVLDFDGEHMAYEWWHNYPEVQMRSVLWLTACLTYEFPGAELVGHCDVDPKRKMDPGPAFPWNAVYSVVDKDPMPYRPHNAL